MELNLSQYGLKTTKSRMAIIGILKNSSQPMAAEQIYLELKNNGESKINLSTVYRTLDTLESKGLITGISIMNDRMLYEYNNMEHRHYLVCLDCKKIVTIQSCPLNNYEKTLEIDTDFDIVGHKLYLYGYCGNCKNKKKA